MKKVLLSGFVVFTFIGYAFQQRLDTENTVAVIPNTPTPTSTGISVIETPITTPIAAAPTATQPPKQLAGAYRNGQYTGSVADAYYGNVQVKAIITNGKISDVQFLQYPSDRRTSQMINSQAMPYLTQEAIQVQSANVNGVSGATATSQAFVQSLSSALSQAK